MWIAKRSANVIFWIHIFLFGLTLAKDTRDVSSVAEVKTEVVYVSQTKPSFAMIWGRHWFSKIHNSRQSSNCGPGLLSCDVEDPTRIEAPWHGVAAPFPQCYDPTAYVCSENFLCPVGAPKIEGQYACGPYTTAQAPSSTGNSGSSSNTAPPQPASTGGDCGSDTLLCEVEDPTRLEAPWHGVSAPFPQCYDPALYTCSENFLCPICAPKIPGQYACGPYISPCPQILGSGGGTGTSTLSSSSSAQISSSLPSSTSSTQPSTNSGLVTTILPTTETLSNGSLTTISGTTETLPSSTRQGGSATLIPPSVSTEPNGSLTTISNTTETLPTGSSGTGSITTIPPSVSTEPNGSLTTISGTTETVPTGSSGSGVGSGGSVTTIAPSVSTEPNGSLTTISGTTETLPTGSATGSGGSVTTMTPSVSTEPNGSLTTISGTTETLPTGSGGSVTTIPPSVSTEPNGSLTTISGTTDGITLGEVTAAPSSTFSTSNPPSSTGPLPVFSTWPSDISVSAETTGPITTGTVTTGTHIYVTTSSSNSQGSSSPFVIWIPHFPCLICGCWFCPPGPSGFDFFGFPGPGIYPPPPPGIQPPGFSSDFPSITIGYDGNPTYSSEPESDKQTSTATTSSSPCSTITATDCTDFVSYGVNTAGSTTTSATSSVCNTVTSCSASDFTTTTFAASCTVSSACSTVTSCPALFGRQVKRQACVTSTACSPASTACPGATTKYIIYPANQDAVSSISNTLSNDFKIDPSLILTAQSQYLGFNYWNVPLTTTQYNSLNGNSLVGAIYPECTENCYDPTDDALTLADSAAESYPNQKRGILNLTDHEIYSKLERRNGGLVRQTGAPDELVHISLGPNLQLAQQSQNYVYDRTGGAGSTVYTIDTGANLAHPEFPEGKEFKEPQWIFAGTSTSRLEEDTGITNNPVPLSQGGGGVISVGISPGHGTAMLSKVSGDTLGIAKSTDNVVVVCPATIKAECYQDALTKVYDDIINNGVTNAVVLMAVYFDPIAPGVTPAWITAVRITLNALANIGVIIVTGAGNGHLPQIRGYPASFALNTLPTTEQVPTLIVVSGTDAYGTIATFFGGTLVLPNKDPNINLAWAPGYDITVADARYNLQLPQSQGGAIAGAYRQGSGTSEAAASVAGLCAYYLGLTDIDDDIRPGPNPIDNAAAMKAYVLRESFQRLGAANIPTVWNGVTISEEFNNPGICPLRVGKRQGPGPDYATCSATSSTSSSSSSSSTSSSTTTTSTSSPRGPTTSNKSTSSTKSKSSSTSTSATPTGTLNCQQNIPTNGPSPSNVAKALTQNNGIASICEAKFDGSGDSTHETFNVGLTDVTLTRPSADTALQFCTEAMNSIINTCILGSADYGGIWNLDGEVYNITNTVFPNNPLTPGAPTTTAPPASSTQTIPPPKTVTTNGAICVLPYGSNDPECEPISTPTPNPAGTNIHVQSGCISINGSPRCAANSVTQVYNVADQNQPYATATIYAEFDSSNSLAENVQPGCELDARWPANYGDIYFNSDNCLVDSSGNQIFNQCCTSPTNAQVINPYQKAPAASCQRSDEVIAIGFKIFANGWISDGGAALKKQVEGCGTVTLWNFGAASGTQVDGSSANLGSYNPQFEATFALPITFKTGCVGRAIESAGGPDGVQC